MTERLPVAATLATLALLIAAVAAQPPTRFRARLSTVPIDIAMQGTVAGHGQARATIDGTRVTIEGTFAGLKSPATVARVHVGPKGIRGPALFELTVTNETRGTITGTRHVTDKDLEDLRGSRWYVQLHSEKAPEGNLWGWLLAEETKQ